MLSSSGWDLNPSQKPNKNQANLQKNHNTLNIVSFDTQKYTNTHGHTP